MTTESHDNDSRVSEAYADLATERTPPELDQAVLSMAANAARSKYGAARAWTRPVAWAATIGLSLAIVLELTRYTAVEEHQAVVPGTLADTDAVESLEETIVLDEAKVGAKDARRTQEEPESRSDAPAAVAAPALRQEPRPTLGGTSVSADFEADDRSMLREAEEQARMRSGSENAPVAEVDSIAADAALSSVAKKEQTGSCDVDSRVSASSWFACVEVLREKGLPDAADRELALLVVEFPDFEVPAKSPDENK